MTTTRDKAYDDRLEALNETYKPRALELLRKVAEVCRAAEMPAGDPYDFSDDEYRYSLRIWRTETARANDDDENSIDVTIVIAEAREYGDEDNPYGLNFALDIVEWGGRILGGLSPYNYTPECWVDARDDEAVEDRWYCLESADLSGIPDLIGEGS